jgi:hypothetical protein
MPKPAFTGDEELAGFLKISYGNARADGLSKEESHAYAFSRMIEFKRNGRIPADPEMNMNVREDKL